LGGGPSAQNYLRAFQALGISMAQLQTMPASQIISGTLAAKIKSTNPEEIAGPLREVFGRGFGQFIPVLKTDFDELGNKMRKTGALIESDMAAKLTAIGTEFDLVGRIITANLAPALLALAEWAYTLALKTGGKIAGGAAYVGGATTGMTLRDWGLISSALGTSGGTAIFSSETRKALYKAYQAAFGAENQKAGRAAMTAAEKPYDKSLSDFNEMLKKAAANLKKQPAILPNFDIEKDAEKPAQKKTWHGGHISASEWERHGILQGASGIPVHDTLKEQLRELRGIRRNTGMGNHHAGAAGAVSYD
jgi:hypothetical protein